MGKPVSRNLKPNKQNQKLQSVRNRLLRYRFLSFTNPIFVLLTFLYYRGLSSRWQLQNGDAAGFVDAMTDQSKTGDINFTYGMSTKVLQKLLTIDPLQLNSSSFLNVYANDSFVHWHPYFFGYFMRLFRFPFFSVEFIPLLTLAASYALGISIIWHHTQKIAMSLGYRIALMVLIIPSPIFVEMINGQPYFDKLFFGPCILILYLILNTEKINHFQFAILIAFTIVCISLSERTSLMASVLSLLALSIKYRQRMFLQKKILAITFLNILGLAWYLIWQQYFSQNPFMANSNLDNYRVNLINLFTKSRNSGFKTLLISILPFLLILSLKKSFLFISIIAILPNLLVSIGGAELTGFASHYHSMYLPVIIILCTLALSNYYLESKTSHKRRIKLRLWVALSMLAAVTSQLNYAKLINTEKPLLEQSTLYAKKIADDLGIIPKNVREQREFIKEEFSKSFDSIDKYPNGSISAPEMFMPTLTLDGFGTIDAFPIGIGNRELLVVPFTDTTFQQIEISLYGLVSPANRILWSNAILKGINNSYEFLSKSSGTYGHVAIYRKTK